MWDAVNSNLFIKISQVNKIIKTKMRKAGRKTYKHPDTVLVTKDKD